MKNNIQPVKDRQGRKYNLTFNNPLDMIPPMSHDEIKKAVGTLIEVQLSRHKFNLFIMNRYM